MPRLASRYGPSPAVLASRIRAERIRLGLTQEAAAARLGIHRGTYSQLEEAANPQASTLIGLVQAVGMDPRALVPELFATPPGTLPIRRPKPVVIRRSGPE